MLLRDDCVLRLGSAAQGAHAQHVAALVVNQPPFHSFIIPGRTWGRCWPFVAMQACQYGMPYVFISSHLSWVLHVRDLDFSFCTPVPDGSQSGGSGEAEASRSVLLPRLTRGAVEIRGCRSCTGGWEVEFGKIGSGAGQGEHGDAGGPGGVPVAVGRSALLMKRTSRPRGTRLWVDLVSSARGWIEMHFPLLFWFPFRLAPFPYNAHGWGGGNNVVSNPAVWYLLTDFSFHI